MNGSSSNDQQDRLNKAAIVIRRLKEKIAVFERAEQDRCEPIAIVGIGCRFPGGATSPETFWELLAEGRDGVQPLDPRWDLVGERPGGDVPRWAGLLTGAIDGFDAAFFGISPREAETLDPQHRLLLEVCWEALEDAGVPPPSLLGSRTGVFVGAYTADYARMVERQPRDQQDVYSVTGNLLSVAAGRLSYTLGLQGPCLTVDTVCSSSLVAIHLACHSLRARESDLALAGGVNLLLSAETMEASARTQALAADGRCKTFDARANGYVRGEGCGLVVLKRLSDAQRDGDRIWALIRGSAVNQDGRSTGLTAPNVLAQEALLREALASARVEAQSVGFVETHGTGTSLGDPIEVEALRAVLGAARPDGARCVLGAVKTNLGHLEAAAGMAGLIKAALALRHEHIPRNLNFRTLNPRIRLEGSALAPATEPVPWPRFGQPRFAGVSSFGLSGTNAHVVLEEAPVSEPVTPAPARSAELFVLSARGEAALSAQAARLREHLGAHPEQALGDVAFSLATTRSHLEHRLAVTAPSREALREALEAAARGETPPGAARHHLRAGSAPKVVFVFPGQGSQWLGMGQTLLAEEPVFRAALEACDRAIQAEAGWSPLSELRAGEASSRLERIDVVQPLLFAMSVGLAALWRSWGVTPDAVVGHSMGEVAAAHVAGILSLEDAARVICRRSRLLRRVSGRGAMGLVELSLSEAEAALAGYADRLSVAVNNGPRSTVISGDPAALEGVLSALEARGVFCRRVRVDVASHSPQMDPLLEELRSLLVEVRPASGRIPMSSTVSGAKVTGPELDAAYWAQNLRAPVLFSGAVQQLVAEGHAVFLELSPHPILLPAVEENLSALDQEGAAVASLRRGSDERRAMLEALAELWARGLGVDLRALHPGGGRVVSLPTYPWQRERFWIEAPARDARPAARESSARDPFDDCVYSVEWRRRDLPAGALSPAQAAERAPWLILRDTRGTGAALAEALRARGEDCVEIDEAQLGELPALLPGACRGVVHCGSLDATPWEQTTPATLTADVRRGSLAAVALAQAILRRAYRDPPRLFLVTRGAQAVGTGPVSAAQAPLWGMARTIALEHPELECTRIDLDATPRTDEVELLTRELCAGDGEEQISLRAEGRFVARLVRSALAAPDAPAAHPAPIGADSTYLITGGLGGLGLDLARWMVEQGARHLVLVGRSAPGEAALAAIRVMEEAGAEVRVLRGDVSRADDVERIVSEIRAELPPLRGVVHAAAVLADRTLLELGEEQLWAPIRPKILGAWNLHAATRGLPLDFFVMYSSMASLLGSPGQAAYGAANAFLDALSHARVAEGLPATSIQWGPFAEVGLAAAQDNRGSRLLSRGIDSFSPGEGAALFARVLERPSAEVGLCRISLRRWIESTPQASGMRFLSELPRERGGQEDAGTESFREALAKAPAASRAALLEAHVIGHLGQVLRIAPSRIDRRAPFTSLGLDSLMGLETRNRLERSLGLTLQATLFFTYPEAASLAEHLLSRLEMPVDDGAPERDERALRPGPQVAGGEGAAASALREALAAVERLRAQLDAAERAKSEPLAVVGMACRFPGGGDSPEAYWQMLERGVDAVREIPAERWPREAIPGDKPEVRRAALLDGIDGFDAAFFGISPREAESLDPQQRLLLEVAWEALEDAGVRPDALFGAPVGVFVGLVTLDYRENLLLRGAEHLDAYIATGNLFSTAGGRISYVFGFQGPNMSVDTACSSSLTSLALACQSLRAGDCDVALAGGVNALLSPTNMALAASIQALSPDGRCKTLDARANGFVRGEGCGMVVLKRLSDALRDGDPIRALIRGWAVNQDGRSSGLTAPNVLSQQALLRRALESARVSPDEIGYVEMHGTGTPLGDPIEADALREVIGRPRADGSTCVLGAVKTNLGHLEGAAGVAGLMKAVLALEHEAVPRNLHFRKLNPRITLDGTPFVIPTESVPWGRGGKRRVAGVSSFGLSGTNAHVVLEEAPASQPVPAAPERSAELLVLSARSAAALTAQAGRLWDHLGAHPELGLGDVAFSLATTRNAMEHRLAVTATSREAALATLEAAARGETPAGAARGVTSSSRGKVAFLFTGQGAQVPGMGRGLYDAWPAFREAFDPCVALFDRELDRPLREVMWSEPGSAEAALLDQTAYTQPALFALEVALVALWRSWGVEPDILAGHSIGEIAAACVAGVFSLDDAARLVAARGRLMQALPAGGAMVSIAAAEGEVLAAAAPHAASVSIAAVNEPAQVVIAGAEEPVLAIAAAFSDRGLRTRRLSVSHAFHSPLMEPMLGELRRIAEAVAYRAPDRPVVSNVTGRVAGPEIATPEYWVRHARQAVRFGDGVKALHEAGVSTFLEVGPRPTLLGLVSACLPDARPGLLASLHARREEAVSVIEALGELWTAGGGVRWAGVFPAGGRRVSLPTYAWQRERHWIEAPTGDAKSSGGRAHRGGHPLLGEAETLSTQAGVRLWQTTLDRARLPWLGDHRVQGLVVLPGAAYLEMALAAGSEALTDSSHSPVLVSDVALLQAMTFPGGAGVEVQVVTTEEQSRQLRFQIASRAPDAAGDSWTVHARGSLRRAARAEPAATLDVAGVRARLGPAEPGGAAYAALSEMGLDFGPAFQGLTELWRGDGEALGRVRLPEAAGAALAYHVHPALLDACFHVTSGAVRDDDERSWMPVEVGSLRLWQRPQGELWCHARLVDHGQQAPGKAAPRRRSADIVVVDASGALVAEVTGLVVQQLAGGPREREEDDWFLELAWESAPAPAARVDAGRFLLLGDGGGLGAALRAALEASGHTVARAVAGSPDRALAGCRPFDDTGAAGVRALLGEAFGGQAPTAVVHLRSLEGEDALDAAAIEAALARGCDSALCTAQALAGMGYRDTPRLWLLTRGAQAAGDGDVSAAQATLLGLGRVIAMEHPELRCARVDLDPARPEREAAAIVAELLGDEAEQEIALRGGERRVGRLVPLRVPARSAAAIRRDGSYLVTGGLGGLGLSVAGWLAERGAGHVVLVSRSGIPSSEQRAAIYAIQARGVRVTVAKADVADRDQVARVLDEVKASGMPLSGVIHAAALLDDGLLLQQSPARFREVMAPKIAGALHLHVLTRGLPLDFFVLYAAAAGLFGSPGQGNYAAANTFLDALAHQRRREGLPALSVDWGAFSEVGLAAAQDNRGARLASRGTRSLTPAQGLKALERLLQGDSAQVAVIPIDTRQWVKYYPAAASSPMFSRLLAEEPPDLDGAGGGQTLAERLALAEPGARASLVLDFLRAQVSLVLRIAERKLDIDAPLTTLGLDSLMGMELRQKLKRDTAVDVPMGRLLTDMTIAKLAELVRDQDPNLASDAAERPSTGARERIEL